MSFVSWIEILTHSKDNRVIPIDIINLYLGFYQINFGNLCNDDQSLSEFSTMCLSNGELFHAYELSKLSLHDTDAFTRHNAHCHIGNVLCQWDEF